MWFFRAVAVDLDGTLAENGGLHGDALRAIDTTRGERHVVLVTGRIGEEMDRAFAGLTGRFDAVVTENGAVFRTGRRAATCPSRSTRRWTRR